MLSHEDWTYVFHNSLFDLAMLKAIGIEVKGRIVDTMLLAELRRQQQALLRP